MYAFAYTHVHTYACNRSMYIFVLCILYSCVGRKSDEDEQIVQAVVDREAKRKVHTYYVYYILYHSVSISLLVHYSVLVVLFMYMHFHAV